MFICRSLNSNNKLPELKYLTHSKNTSKKVCSEILNEHFDEIIKMLDNLICNDGYLQQVYNIISTSINWLIGWEISKLLHNKIFNTQTESDVNITGFFANTSTDFISGFLYYTSTIYPENHISCKCFIYNENEIINIDTTGKLLIDNKQFSSTIVNFINTIDYDDTKFPSVNICRYLNNSITANSIYLNFSIINPLENSISAMFPSLINLHEKHGIFATCFNWYKKNGEIADETVLYMYTLSCIFTKINLLWIPWDSRIWVLCYDKNKSFDKTIYADLIESEGFDLNSIKKDYKMQFENIKQECQKFIDLISKERKKIDKQLSKNEEYLIKTWLENNEKHLERINVL